MYTKLVIFALLGATFVTANPLFLEDNLLNHGVSDYFHKWMNTIQNHYNNLQNIAKDLGAELKSEIHDAYHLSKEAVDSIQQKAEEASKAALNKYEEEKIKWNARVKVAMSKGKEYAAKVQAEASEALNKYYEIAQQSYQKIKEEIKEAIREEELKAKKAHEEKKQQ